jgi:hypothetical protein
MLKTPVALLIFNRPDFTARVLQAVAQAKPRQLLVVADGPRPDVPGEAERCAAARAVIDRVDWDCEVLKNYSEVNLGCGRGPATGISWIFEQVPEAIILEDDCVPDPSFFRFCELLLERYREDERIMHIGGSTYQREVFPTPYSYSFSCFNGAWGWATWRRAWKHFDLSLKLWPSLRDTTWLRDILENEETMRIWADEFEQAYQREGDVSYWDFQWTFACWANRGLSIRPRHNLVSNIGCCSDATHTLSAADPRANLPTEEMHFPLIHPPMVVQNRELDRSLLKEYILSQLPRPRSQWQRLRRFASRCVPEFMKEGYRSLAAANRSTPT